MNCKLNCSNEERVGEGLPSLRFRSNGVTEKGDVERRAIGLVVLVCVRESIRNGQTSVRE